MTTPETTTDAAALIATAQGMAEDAPAISYTAWAPVMLRLASALEASLEREERLREALRPFAAVAEVADYYVAMALPGEEGTIYWPVPALTHNDGGPRAVIGVRDFHRARAALVDAP